MMEKIKIKRVKFNTGAPDFIYSIEQWYGNGGYKGFIKDNCISILDIECVETSEMSEKEFYSLPAWEG